MDKLTMVGELMSNVMFNWSQDGKRKVERFYVHQYDDPQQAERDARKFAKDHK